MKITVAEASEVASAREIRGGRLYEIREADGATTLCASNISGNRLVILSSGRWDTMDYWTTESIRHFIAQGEISEVPEGTSVTLTQERA